MIARPLAMFFARSQIVYRYTAQTEEPRYLYHRLDSMSVNIRRRFGYKSPSVDSQYCDERNGRSGSSPPVYRAPRPPRQPFIVVSQLAARRLAIHVIMILFAPSKLPHGGLP